MNDNDEILRVIYALADKIEAMDKHMNDALTLVQTISDNVSPTLDKLANHPILKGFLK